MAETLFLNLIHLHSIQPCLPHFSMLVANQSFSMCENFLVRLSCEISAEENPILESRLP